MRWVLKHDFPSSLKDTIESYVDNDVSWKPLISKEMLSIMSLEGALFERRNSNKKVRVENILYYSWVRNRYNEFSAAFPVTEFLL